MHAILTLQEAIGKLATLYLHGDTLDTSLITVKQVTDCDFIAMSLSPAHIHTHQHLRPVLSLSTTSTRVNLEHAVHGVFLLAQHVHKFQFLDGIDSLLVVFIHLLLGHHLVFIEIEGQLQFVGLGTYIIIAINPFLDSLYLLHLLLSTLGVFPEVRRLSTKIFFFEFNLFLVYLQIVKQFLSSV